MLTMQQKILSHIV